MSRGLIVKLLLVAVIVGLVLAFWAFNLGHYFTLSYLKGSADRLKGVYAGHRALVILVYFLVYVLTTSLSLPGAAVLTLAGGAPLRPSGRHTGRLIREYSGRDSSLSRFTVRF